MKKRAAVATITPALTGAAREAAVVGFCDKLRSNVDVFYGDGNFDGFNTRNRSTWDDIQAAGMRDDVAFAMRPS